MTTVRQLLQSNQRCHHKKFKRFKKLQEQKGRRHVDQWEVYYHDFFEGISSLFCKIDALQDHVVLEELHSLATTHGQEQVRLELIKKVEIGGLRCIGIHIHFSAAWCMNQGMWGNMYLTLMLQTRLEYDYGQATASEQPAVPSQEVQEIQEAPRTEGQEACRSMGSLF